MSGPDQCGHGKDIDDPCAECSAEIAAAFDPGLVIPCRCNEDGSSCGGSVGFLDADEGIFLDVTKTDEKGVFLDVDAVDTIIANLCAWRAGVDA